MYTHKIIVPFLAKLKPSKLLQQINSAIHLAAWLACFANALPLSIQLCIAFLIGLDFWFNFKRLKSGQNLISYSDTKGWQLADNGGFENIQSLSSTVITAFLIFLHIANKPSIHIAHDALSAEDFRRLIVKLKMTTNKQENPH